MARKRMNVSIAPELYEKLCEAIPEVHKKEPKSRPSLYNASKAIGIRINIKDLFK